MLGKRVIAVCYIDSSNLGNVVVMAAEELNSEFSNCFNVHIIPLWSIADPKTKPEQLGLIEAADLVLVDIRGSNPLIKDILEATRRGKATVASLLGGSFELMGLTRMGIFDANKFFNGPRFQKLSAGGLFSNINGETNFDDIDLMLRKKLPGFVYKDIGAWFEVTRYWGINGKENVKRLLVFMGKNYCRLKRLPAPLPPLKEPSPSIRHPNMPKLYTELPEYLADYGFDTSKPTAVLLYYDGMHMENCLVPTRSLINALEPDINVIPISCDGMKNVASVRKLMFPAGKFVGDILIPLVWFRFNGGPMGGSEKQTFELFREINVPVFHPITSFNQSLESWKADKQGVYPVEFLANVTLPECDGMIEPVILCATDERLETAYSPVTAIPDRVERYAGRIRKMLALRSKNNADKKVALIVYNYPPGEHNLANAAYLDSFASLRSILTRMANEGYNVGDIPEDFSKAFLENGIVNSPNWSSHVQGVKIGKAEYDSLTAANIGLRTDVESYWGCFPGNVNTEGGCVMLPLLQLGNITVAIQPSRGFHEDTERNYHDKSIPPHHQYVAFYKWLQETQDAIVHIGTHGTLEFLRGKEQAIASEDDMDILLGNLPHFYLYQTGNPSEAMIAKRRALASLISYSTPPAESSGLYGAYLSMQDMFDELDSSSMLEPQRKEEIVSQICTLASENGWDDLEGDIHLIQSRLTAMSRSLIPIGLHTFGTAMTEEEKVRLSASILRFDRGDTMSLNRIIAVGDGLDYNELLSMDSPLLKGLDEKSESLVRQWIETGHAGKEYSRQFELVAELMNALETDHELDGLINALNGGYGDAGLSADSLRNPEVFPSGRNLYQFNPLTLPTPSAVTRGAQIARNTLELYYKKNGCFPKSVGVVLWGFETAKTCGETVGQIFEYLGVRTKSEQGSWFPRIEVIPASELSHPRIDTMIEICGFFRDLFPNLMDMLDDAVRAVSSLDEKDNAVREKTISLRGSLLCDGYSEQEADVLSTVRIFGPPESEYGTSLTTMIETGRWEDEAQLGSAYTLDMGFAYSRELRGKPMPRLNEMLLSQVELISQVQDTYEYDITDLDHYYEFFGGFSKAIENSRGISPQMITTNTATEKIRTEDASLAISRGAVTRTLNPKWIDAMLEHEYHGAQKVADRVQYLVGLSATTGVVEPSVWDKTAQTLVFDDKMRRRLEENNIYAAQEIAKRLYEADKRGYWRPSPEQEQALMELLMSYDEDLEGGR